MAEKASSQGGKNGKSTYLTTSEACQRLQMTVRNFRLLRKRLGAVEGQTIVGGTLMFPIDALDEWHRRYEGSSPEDDEPSVEDGLPSMVHELVGGMKQIMSALAPMLGSVQQAVEASVKAVEGTDARTSLILQENKRIGDQQGETQKLMIEMFTLVKDLYIDQGRLEAERLKAEGDQTVRVERTRLAAKGIRQLAPLAKAGLARWAGLPGIAREAQAEGIMELVASLKQNPEKLMKLQEKLTEKQREAVGLLLSFAEGSEKLPEALKMLKADMDDAQREELQKLLDDKQLMAIAQLFEEVDDDDDKPEAKEPVKKSA